MHCSLTVLFIPQELEPSVGEELCRLFPEDETVDIHPHRTSERRVREKKEISRLGPVMVAEWSGGVLTARCPRWDIKCWHPRGPLETGHSTGSSVLKPPSAPFADNAVVPFLVQMCWTYLFVPWVTYVCQCCVLTHSPSFPAMFLGCLRLLRWCVLQASPM